MPVRSPGYAGNAGDQDGDTGGKSGFHCHTDGFVSPVFVKGARFLRIFGTAEYGFRHGM